MSNEIKTHRLIVTLPNTSGEEADVVASHLQARARFSLGQPEATVTHALGESLPDLVAHCGIFAGNAVELNLKFDNIHLTALEARQLAGVLLAHAHEIEEV